MALNSLRGYGVGRRVVHVDEDTEIALARRDGERWNACRCEKLCNACLARARGEGMLEFAETMRRVGWVEAMSFHHSR